MDPRRDPSDPNPDIEGPPAPAPPTAPSAPPPDTPNPAPLPDPEPPPAGVPAGAWNAAQDAIDDPDTRRPKGVPRRIDGRSVAWAVPPHTRG